MALYQVDVEKSFGGEFWTNRYVINSSTLENADEGADIIVARERIFHRESVQFTKVRTRTFVAGDDTYSSRPLSGSGEVPPSGALLPLFNVIRVDFPAEGGGRPSRKYYRIGICAGDMADDFIVNNTILSLTESGLAGMIAELAGNATPFVDVDGQELSDPTAFATIAMRQLRKGSRRRTEPIL